MDSNILIFIIVALALVAILYFAWPRTKAEPPRIEKPAEPVTQAVPTAAPEPVIETPAKVAKAAAPKTAKKAPALAKAAPVKAAPAKATPAPKKASAKAAVPKPDTATKPKTTPAAKAATSASKKPAPKPAAAVKATTAAPQIPDDIALLKGVGPKLVALLQSMGVTSLEQIAAWSPADVTEIDSKLGTFAGRINRDNWVDQAKLLTTGDVTAFEKKYGSLGSEIKKG
jgi:predicted flap endonuclease-1-like 5' DNA nuclease